jgi:CYTH domain-containing protein
MKEVERKFLVSPAVWSIVDTLDIGGGEIEQGYFVANGTIRVRRDHYEQKCSLTIKTETASGLLVRDEFEYPIVEELFEKMYDLSIHTLTKFRHRWDRWVLDEFNGSHSGLWILEIELTSPTEPLPNFPDEIKSFVDREVTGYSAYYNENLAKFSLLP